MRLKKMAKNNTIPTRTAPEFKKLLEEIQLKRITMGKDKINKRTSKARITLAITRHNLTQKIVNDIVNAELN